VSGKLDLCSQHSDLCFLHSSTSIFSWQLDLRAAPPSFSEQLDRCSQGDSNSVFSAAPPLFTGQLHLCFQSRFSGQLDLCSQGNSTSFFRTDSQSSSTSIRRATATPFSEQLNLCSHGNSPLFSGQLHLFCALLIILLSRQLCFLCCEGFALHRPLFFCSHSSFVGPFITAS